MSPTNLSPTASKANQEQPGTRQMLMFPAHLDENRVQEIWLILKSGIQEIQRKNKSGLIFEELYRYSYTLVMHKKGDLLYDGVKDVIRQHLEDTIRTDVLNSLNNEFLQVLSRVWSDHQASMEMIGGILRYMDRVYVKQSGVDNVHNLGLNLFRDHIVNDSIIRDHLRNILLAQIAIERRGEFIEAHWIKNVCQMLVQLGIDKRTVYEEIFEQPFLEQSAEFYRSESQRYLNENCASTYIREVEQRIEEESKRAQRYLDPGTEQKIVQVVERELITNHMTLLVEMSIPRYSQGKNVFERFYKQQLVQQPLLNESSSGDLEKNMISKLKTECSCQHCSETEQNSYGVDLNVRVMPSAPRYASRVFKKFCLAMSRACKLCPGCLD